MVSISPTLYEQLLRQNPFAKKLQTQIVSTEKLFKKFSCEKAARKMLVKLTPEQLARDKELACFVVPSVTKKKSFITITQGQKREKMRPGDNFIKLFSALFKPLSAYFHTF
jgi:hypothetical protein